MTRVDPSLEERKVVTFAQAEGIDPIPQQLNRGELTTRLRNAVWFVIHTMMSSNSRYSDVS